MKFMAILAFLSMPALAEDVPYYPRSTQSNQDLGAVNANTNDLAIKSKNNLAATITPQNCAAGVPLTGAYFNKGSTVGGSCSGALTVSTITFSDGTTLTKSPVFSSTQTHLSAVNIGVSDIGASGNTGGNTCLTGSTITFTSNGWGISCYFQGTFVASANGYGITMLMDGVYFSSYTATHPAGFFQPGTVMELSVSEFVYPPPAAASHTFCVQAGANGGGTIYGDNATTSTPLFRCGEP